MAGTDVVANFIVTFDIDITATTAVLLEAQDYSTEPSAPIGAWFLLELNVDSSEPEWESEANGEIMTTGGHAAAAASASETADSSRGASYSANMDEDADEALQAAGIIL